MLPMGYIFAPQGAGKARKHWTRSTTNQAGRPQTTAAMENTNSTQDAKYKVVKIGRKSGRRTVLERGLTLDQARRCVMQYPDSNRSMVVFFRQ